MQSPCDNGYWLFSWKSQDADTLQSLLAAAEIDNTSSEVKQAESNKF